MSSPASPSPSRAPGAISVSDPAPIIKASAAGTPPLEIDLSAAIVALLPAGPALLTVSHGIGEGLPLGPFEPLAHRTMEQGLHAWVRQQAGLDLGYAEQLYTFGDRGRHAEAGDAGPHVVSVGYLALTRSAVGGSGRWAPWYRFFPWEDHRAGRPAVLDTPIAPALTGWAIADPVLAARRQSRIARAFGDGRGWPDELVLDRYELLYEAGLVAEAAQDGRAAPDAAPLGLGSAMVFDHRRILATAMSRLRAKIRYRPVLFELLPPEFTLLTLQRATEAVRGVALHKPNFRRGMLAGSLIAPTREMRAGTGGRPARLYRFRLPEQARSATGA